MWVSKQESKLTSKASERASRWVNYCLIPTKVVIVISRKFKIVCLFCRESSHPTQWLITYAREDWPPLPTKRWPSTGTSTVVWCAWGHSRTHASSTVDTYSANNACYPTTACSAAWNVTLHKESAFRAQPVANWPLPRWGDQLLSRSPNSRLRDRKSFSGSERVPPQMWLLRVQQQKRDGGILLLQMFSESVSGLPSYPRSTRPLQGTRDHPRDESGQPGSVLR